MSENQLRKMISLSRGLYVQKTSSSKMGIENYTE